MGLPPVALLLVAAFVVVPLYLGGMEHTTFSIQLLVAMAVFHVAMYYVGFLPKVRKAESWFRQIAR